YGDEYAMIPVGVPKLTTEQLFSDMFAVYSGCSALERCMGILTYLNTNETIRNLLLYGIEGENYEMVNSKYLDEDGVPYKVVRRLNDSYVMDVNKTGNTLLAYTPEGENPLAKQYAMMQNLDAVADLALGFSMTYDGNTVDAEGLQTLRKCSKEIYDQIIACQTMEELEALLQEFVYASTSDDELRVALEQRDKSKKPTSSKGSSFAYIYYEWLEDNDIYVEED
ncbi:MAG: hypothetical protein IJY42_02060, partial [Clostridia bacterium]|nr:hypothetical protein [Clostridia bacterium]